MHKRIIGISTGPDTHLDHLGVLCSILKIPLIVIEETTFRLAKKFYPECETIHMDPVDLSLKFLAENFDVIFECGKFWAFELVPLFELLHQKKMRIVFCPHGNSDKGHSLLSDEEHIKQDLSLVYGNHMIDLLKKTGAFLKIRQIVRTGNYRSLFYRTHRSFYDNCASEQIFFRLEGNRKTILYAPTWGDKENPTSFFEACDDIVQQLEPVFNLVIKLHPFLEEHHPAQTYRILAQYENHPHVVFLNGFPPIYPLLARSDIYVGDFSSIGYDFLTFDRPMYFFNPIPKENRSCESSFLHRCGMEIPREEIKNIRRFIEESLEHNDVSFSPYRKEIHKYAFGEEVSFDQLQNEILSALIT